MFCKITTFIKHAANVFVLHKCDSYTSAIILGGRGPQGMIWKVWIEKGILPNAECLWATNQIGFSNGVDWECATKRNICCMVFKANMHKILSKCTTYGQQKYKIWSNSINYCFKKCKYVIFVPQIFEKLHGPH